MVGGLLLQRENIFAIMVKKVLALTTTVS